MAEYSLYNAIKMNKYKSGGRPGWYANTFICGAKDGTAKSKEGQSLNIIASMCISHGHKQLILFINYN